MYWYAVLAFKENTVKYGMCSMNQIKRTYETGATPF